MLGDINIGQYVEKQNISDQRLNYVKAKVEEIENLKKDCLTSEKDIYDKLYADLYSEMISREYPRIDLSFLEKSHVLKKTIKTEAGFFSGASQKEISIPVPAFSVYSFYGSNIFSIKSGSISSNIHSRIKDKLFRSLYDKTINGNFVFNPEKYTGIEIQSKFIGLIPQKTKEKVEKSLEHFFKDAIYLVAETKPEEWNVEKIKIDPLVIGLIANKDAHLIAHFDTTPLEDLVKDNFLGDKLS